MKIIILIAVFSVIFSQIPNPIDVSKLKIAKTASQIFLVYPDKYTSSEATILFHSKKSDGNWSLIFSTRGYIGRYGLGKTKEGDGKTPVGLFNFTKKFGIKDNPGCPVEYIKVDDSMYWNGDSNSDRYNKLVSTKTYTSFDKSKSEHLISIKPHYNYAANINYNPEGIPHKGSAIFLHCFGPNKYTGGCVAIHEAYMHTVMTMIKEGAYIIIDEYKNLDKY